MTTPTQPLARHDINAHAEKFHHVYIPNSTGDKVLDTYLFDLSNRFCGQQKSRHVLALLAAVMNAAQCGNLSKHEYKSLSVVLKELVEADGLFHDYDHVRKVTCFGSARTPRSHPNYCEAKELGRLASDAGYMMITGGGPGIMQAANEGAGSDHSFGLNISLPFEQHPNEYVQNCGRLMNFYYFFTRKLNLIKQSDALVTCPGGFGTMDEIYEAMTLMQTGKAAIFPIILLDSPSEDYWNKWMEFNRDTILADGLVSPDDMRLLYHCQNAKMAMDYISHFYSVFHSYYFDGDAVVIRLNESLSEAQVQGLQQEYKGNETIGAIAYEEKGSGRQQPELAHLPRLRVKFKHGNYARLRIFIDSINDC